MIEKAASPSLKLELYSLHRAFGVMKRYLIGVHNLIVEVDARYIKGMLANPDLHPGVTVSLGSLHHEPCSIWGPGSVLESCGVH